jgi:Trypsin-like peptidase domain
MANLIQRPMKIMAVLLLTAVATFLATPVSANEKVYAQAVHGTVLILAPGGGFGTGVLVDMEKRLVVTAAHVAPEDENITAVFAEFDSRGRVIAERAHYFNDKAPQAIAAKVLARQTDRDLLVLQLASLPKGVQVVKLASDSAAPGQAVHVLGNASLYRNALFGTRSGKVDSVYRNEPTSEFPLNARLIANSIPANKGDSGGPLLNDDCELVGIVSQGTVTWATARNAGHDAEEILAQHPLGFQQSVTLGIDVTEVRAILKTANGAEPKTQIIRKPGRSLVSSCWTCEIDKGAAEIVFRADGTYLMTTSNAEGVLVDSQRGGYTYTEGPLMLRPANGEQTIATVTWAGDDCVAFTVNGSLRFWTRR